VIEEEKKESDPFSTGQNLKLNSKSKFGGGLQVPGRLGIKPQVRSSSSNPSSGKLMKPIGTQR
jgi:hypothetical protein